MQEQHSFLDAPARGEYAVPEGARPETCRSCGAPIVWAHTPANTAIPLSLANVRVISGQRYALAHFADCPQGREWRKK